MYKATVDEMTGARTAPNGEAIEAIAVHPHHLPDLVRLLTEVLPELAGELARLAAHRAKVPSDFDA
ncbi:MAG TPA: hypothetical protein VIT22_07115 [Pseudoxanthomonas sp.]